MALGQNYLGQTYLGGVGVVTPHPPSLLPWVYVSSTGELRSSDVTQFLQLHNVTVIEQGQVVTSVTNDLVTWQTLGEVDQPFVASQSIEWLRIPLTNTELAPTLESGWSNASPITVSLYTDSAGQPGTLLASTVLPAEQIESVQLDTWPEPADVLFGAAVVDAQASLPQLPGTGWSGVTTLVAGAWGVMLATQSTNPTQMWLVPYDGTDLGGWIAGTPLPTSGFEQMIYAPTAETLVLLSENILWSAVFSQSGTVGSWQQLASPPVSATLIGILTYDAADYLVAVSTDGQTWFATLSSSGSIGPWLAGLTFPVAFSSGQAFQTTTDLVFVVEASGITTLISVSQPQGGWAIAGTIASSSVVGVIGQSLISGSPLVATTLTEFGVAQWSLPVPLPITNVALLAFSLGTQYAAFWLPTAGGSGYQQPVYLPSWANVPLPQTLTAGTTYHLVLSSSSSLTVGVAVPVVSGSSGLLNDNGWVALGGDVPFLAFAGNGAPLALVATDKTTLMWFDTPSGALTTTVEVMSDTSTSRVLTYTEDVLIEVA